MQFVPSRFICVTAYDSENGQPRIRRKRRAIGQEFLEALAAAGDNFAIVQIAQDANQTCAQGALFRRLVLLRRPAQSVKHGPQNRACVFLKMIALRLAGEEPINEIEHVDDLLMLGQFGCGGQFSDKIDIKGERCAIRLHERPRVAQQIHTIGFVQLRKSCQQKLPRRIVVLNAVVPGAVHIKFDCAVCWDWRQFRRFASHEQTMCLGIARHRVGEGNLPLQLGRICKIHREPFLRESDFFSAPFYVNNRETRLLRPTSRNFYDWFSRSLG